MMNKSPTRLLEPMPTPEEIEFFIREGKKLQSEVVHKMLKTAFRFVINGFSGSIESRERHDQKAVTPIDGHHAHGN